MTPLLATVLVVVGAPGTAEYEVQFRQWAERWQAAAAKGSAGFHAIGLEPEMGTADRDLFKKFLSENAAGTEPLWIVLVGHGTFDGKNARFNLRGPDVTSAELTDWLNPIKRPVAVIDCTSASGPFINHLSGANRVVVTATRSGSETNFARFGQYVAEAIGDLAADLDKDGQVSLLEAYLFAGSRVAEFYKSEARLATEHPLIDDNGDKLGTPPDWFQGVRAVKRAKDGAAPDGIRAHQWCLIPSDRERATPADVRKKRDELELGLAALRDQKAQLGDDEYYARLEKLMVELARLYEKHLPGEAYR